MNANITNGLYETVICNEFRKYAEEHSDEWNDLAKDCAVEMLEEIKRILDEPISLEDMRMKIMKIVLFIDTPPYPKRYKQK